MFMHNKRLQYTVRASETNPGLANLMLEQFGANANITKGGNDSHPTQLLYAVAHL